MGLLRALSSREVRIIRTDELRRAIESLEPSQYEKLSYYERWAEAIETLLVEKSFLTREEIDRRVEEADG